MRPTDASRARGRVLGDFRLVGLDTSRRDRSRRELCPAPLSSDTSCCELVVTADGASRHHPGAVAGVRCEPVITKRGERFVRKVPTGFAGPSVRVAPDSTPRRVKPGAVPEVPSVIGKPSRGPARSTVCPQPVDCAGAFSIPTVRLLDEVTDLRGTRLRAVGDGKPTPVAGAPAAPPTTSAFEPFREIGRAHV